MSTHITITTTTIMAIAMMAMRTHIRITPIRTSRMPMPDMAVEMAAGITTGRSGRAELR